MWSSWCSLKFIPILFVVIEIYPYWFHLTWSNWCIIKYHCICKDKENGTVRAVIKIIFRHITSISSNAIGSLYADKMKDIGCCSDNPIERFAKESKEKDEI